MCGQSGTPLARRSGVWEDYVYATGALIWKCSSPMRHHEVTLPICHMAGSLTASSDGSRRC